MKTFIFTTCGATLLSSAFARHRLEPQDGFIVHGGGSGEADFRPYAQFMGTLAPAAYMTYLGLDTLNNTAPGEVDKWFVSLNDTLSSYGEPEVWYLAPQIGLSLPHKGKEIIIPEGHLDPAIAALVTGLRYLQRPIFLRIGYEFNGPWNGYKTDSYRDAYKHITGFLRADNITNISVATIWDRTCDDTNDDKPFYPGDEAVDWWGINIYSGHSEPSNTDCVKPFLDKASAAGFPVALGEVTPRGKFTDKSSTWDEWFAPYFKMLSDHQGVKLTSYINRQWYKDGSYRGWGDSRVQIGNSSGIAAKYTNGMNNSVWINKLNRSDLFAALGLPPGLFERA
jgi:hypothetical protein